MEKLNKLIIHKIFLSLIVCNGDGIESNSKFIFKITIQVLEIQKNNIKTFSIKK